MTETYDFDCAHCGENLTGDFLPNLCPNCGKDHTHQIGSARPSKFVPEKGKKYPHGTDWIWCATEECKARVRAQDIWKLAYPGISREPWKYGKRFKGKGKARAKQGSRGKR